MPQSPGGKLHIDECTEAFKYYSDLNTDVRKPVIHFSLNPSPKDELTTNQMIGLAQEFMERMGYGEQPYIIFQHSDIDRRHMHIVSVRVDGNGQEIPYRFDLKRAIAHCREMEQKYGLHPPGESDTLQEIAALHKVDYPAGDVKEQVKRTARTLIERYNVRSLPELNTLLELYNICIDEVKGVQNGEAYHGLLYGALTDTGQRVGTPFKASRLGEAFG
ncbi:relaxase/mobilization nuclease domain-containing protein [Alistipes indistinctus]